MKKNILQFTLISAIVLLTGCGRPTTGAEIDRIMAEAREHAAQELAKSRGAWGSTATAADEAEDNRGVITTASAAP